MVVKRARVLVAAAALAVCAVGAAQASGVAGTLPWYIDRLGGEPRDLNAFYAGRLGVVMAKSPRPHLYMAWRLLHGQQVGLEAGRSLSVPCCSQRTEEFFDPPAETTPSARWLEARKLVPGAPQQDHTPLGQDEPSWMWAQSCYDDALRTATSTLRSRVASHGAGSAGVRAWLAAQDAVFANCRQPTALPPAPVAAPAWLRADRAYQEAAAAFYADRMAEAAQRFDAIARDAASPWRPMGPYLKARVLRRVALGEDEPVPAAYAAARAAIADLQRAPPGTFGREEATPMLRSLTYRDRPRDLLVELTRELSGVAPPRNLAVSFRDLWSLSYRVKPKADVIDWIDTMRPEISDEAEAAADYDPTALARLRRQARGAALNHAIETWNRGRDTAWLIAALSLADPGAPQSAALVVAGEGIRAADPGWLTVQYHVVRLTMARAPADATRRRLDAILARDLAVSDRNLFMAQRLQVAADSQDLVRQGVRRRVCADTVFEYGRNQAGCMLAHWLPDYVQARGVYDGRGAQGTRGLGEDARAVIDRLPLRERIAVSRDPRLPAQLRLDVALTSYARAVALQDRAAVDGLAGDLAGLLPQLAPEWRRIRAAPTGRARRFAELFVFAKVPGLRTDLADYTRPEGSVANFQHHWIDWHFLPRGRPAAGHTPPPLALYQQDGTGVGADEPDAVTDLTCLGECGGGVAPLRLPDFAAALQGRAAAERAYFIRRDPEGYTEATQPLPAGAVSAWEEMLAYARANPQDPQVPEALYWLIRAGRWGGTHERSGRRAFQLLHARYPGSAWARRAPYYYD